ncbi:MAG: response regulator transcription factor [Firmicutes bacterium]|nr:response regulator transcription factor [Bacillota bacterium]
MAKEKIRVLVVDDHEMVRLGLVSYLETEPAIEVVGQEADGAAAVESAAKLKPDVILMDLVMEGADGIQATKTIVSQNSHVKVIALTSFAEDDLIYRALEAGAAGYLLKTATAAEITQSIFSVAQGQTVFDPHIAKKLVENRQTDALPHLRLTEREWEVLTLIAAGLSNQEIADNLHIGVKTVKTHVSNILSKLELSDRTQAAVYAHRHGLV